MTKRLQVYKSDHNNQAQILNRWVQPFITHVLHGDSRQSDQVVHVEHDKRIIEELKWMLLKYAEATGIKIGGHWRVTTNSMDAPNYQMFALFAQDYCEYARRFCMSQVPTQFFAGTNASFQRALKSGVIADFNNESNESKATVLRTILTSFTIIRALLQCYWYVS